MPGSAIWTNPAGHAAAGTGLMLAEATQLTRRNAVSSAASAGRWSWHKAVRSLAIRSLWRCQVQRAIWISTCRHNRRSLPKMPNWRWLPGLPVSASWRADAPARTPGWAVAFLRRAETRLFQAHSRPRQQLRALPVPRCVSAPIAGTESGKLAAAGVRVSAHRGRVWCSRIPHPAA